MTSTHSPRPVPGPRAEERPYWNGHTEVAPTRDFRRLVGLDAARGFALFGMFAVHVLPMVGAGSGTRTYASYLFAGHSAPLFGLLAGVSLALLTGARNPHIGRRLRRSRVSIATRAVILLVVGLALNLLPLSVFNILPYYALYFLLGLLFVGMRVRHLLGWAVVFAVAGPLVLFYGFDYFFFVSTPDLLEAVRYPVSTLSTLLFSGTYPAATWMTYILLGLALGRLDLGNLTTQIRLCVYGALAGFGALLVSDWAINMAGGFDRLVAASPTDNPREAVLRTLHYQGTVPNTTEWWLLANVAHGNSLVSVASTAGLAVFALGGFLLAARVFATLLSPMAKAGSMTFTLYTAHLVFMAFVDVTLMPVLWFIIFVVFSVFFAVAWLTFRRQGPLEEPMSKISKAVGRRFVRDGDTSGLTVAQSEEDAAAASDGAPQQDGSRHRSRHRR